VRKIFFPTNSSLLSLSPTFCLSQDGSSVPPQVRGFGPLCLILPNPRRMGWPRAALLSWLNLHRPFVIFSLFFPPLSNLVLPKFAFCPCLVNWLSPLFVIHRSPFWSFVSTREIFAFFFPFSTCFSVWVQKSCFPPPFSSPLPFTINPFFHYLGFLFVFFLHGEGNPWRFFFRPPFHGFAPP